MKAYKIELIIDEIKNAHDDHPLNKLATEDAEFQRLFAHADTARSVAT